MRDLMRRLERLEDCIVARVVPGNCICRSEPVKLVALQKGDTMPSVTECPAHPDAIRLIVIRGIDPVTREARREFVEIIQEPTCVS